MRVIFMGTPVFAVGTLQALQAADHEISLVVTQPDKPRGRSGKMQFPPVKEVALKMGLPVYQPDRISAEESVDMLRRYAGDVMVVVAFGQILPKEVLTMTPYGCINVHASLLPRYRGAAPIPWAILGGDTVTGVTTMQMDEGLDTGDILLSREIPITLGETGGSLHDKLSVAGAGLCVETLQALQEETVHPRKQGESSTPYASMLTRETGRIDWNEKAEMLERKIRGLSPWPGTYTTMRGELLKLWGSRLGEKTGNCCKACAGMVVAVKEDCFTVATGEGTLDILEVQLAGKKRMDTASFLRGYPVEAGELLGQ